MKWFFFIVFVAMAAAARLIGGDILEDDAGSALLTLGIVIIGGVLAGELARRVRLPRITGYLVLGLLIGPHALALESAADASFLRLFEELALGLIALTAGGEFRLVGLRRRLRALISITLGHTVGLLLVVAGVMWFVLQLLPGFGGLSPSQLLAAAALLGVIAAAKSPATTVAVITELRARGELVETVLGVTILKDLVILLLFSAVAAVAKAWARSETVDLAVISAVLHEILLSLLVGAFLGLLFGAYIALVGRHLQLTVVLLALVSVEVARQSAVEHLLVCMAAGFVVRNLFPRSAGGFLDALERSSPPIYVVFFALVGAGLDLGLVATVWLPALVYVGVRLAAVWGLTNVAARLGGAGANVVRYGWMGFVAQAGLSLGLAARIQRDLPTLGPPLATLIIAGVVVNQLVGPVLWAHALTTSGEARDASPRHPIRRPMGAAGRTDAARLS